MSFKIDLNSLQNSLLNLETKKDRAIRVYAETSAKKLESDAKKKAIWTNRTGHARQRLSGTTTKYEKGWRLALSHGVNYGKYLEMTNNPKWSNSNNKNELTAFDAEFKYEKKFAIIMPTIRITGKDKIIPGLKNLFDKMK